MAIVAYVVGHVAPDVTQLHRPTSKSFNANLYGGANRARYGIGSFAVAAEFLISLHCLAVQFEYTGLVFDAVGAEWRTYGASVGTSR